MAKKPGLNTKAKHFLPVSFIEATAEEMEAVKKELGGDLPNGYIAGWASTPGVDTVNHVVATGAFDKSISNRGLMGPRCVKLLHNHDWDKLLGAVRKLENRNGRLWIEAQINLEVEYARDLYSNAKMVGGLNFSVGFFIKDWDYDENKDIFKIKEGDLFEVSVVPFPANEEATMEFIKSLHEDDEEIPLASLPEFEKYLVRAGIVSGRKAANRVTQVVKRCAPLFGKSSGDPALPGGPPSEPALSPENEAALKALSASFESVSKVLTTAAPKS